MPAKKALEYVVQGLYNQKDGWEDLATSPNRTEAQEDLACYREIEKEVSFRLITRQTESTQ